MLSSVGREKRNWRPAFGCLPPISKIFTLCAGCARAAQDESFRVLKEGIYPARQVCHNYILNSLTSHLFYHQLSRCEFRFIVALSIYIYSATHREPTSVCRVHILFISSRLLTLTFTWNYIYESLLAVLWTVKAVALMRKNLTMSNVRCDKLLISSFSCSLKNLIFGIFPLGGYKTVSIFLVL